MLLAVTLFSTLMASVTGLLRSGIQAQLGWGQAIAPYQQMERDARFRNPKPYAALRVADYDALVLSGGHAQGVKSYLGSETLQGFVADFLGVEESSALTVKVEVPVAVGVPEMVPELLKLRPAGRLPARSAGTRRSALS